MSCVTLAQVESTAIWPPRYQVNSVETGQEAHALLHQRGPVLRPPQELVGDVERPEVDAGELVDAAPRRCAPSPRRTWCPAGGRGRRTPCPAVRRPRRRRCRPNPRCRCRSTSSSWPNLPPVRLQPLHDVRVQQHVVPEGPLLEPAFAVGHVEGDGLVAEPVDLAQREGSVRELAGEHLAARSPEVCRDDACVSVHVDLHRRSAHATCESCNVFTCGYSIIFRSRVTSVAPSESAVAMMMRSGGIRVQGLGQLDSDTGDGVVDGNEVEDGKALALLDPQACRDLQLEPAPTLEHEHFPGADGRDADRLAPAANGLERRLRQRVRVGR